MYISGNISESFLMNAFVIVQMCLCARARTCVYFCVLACECVYKSDCMLVRMYVSVCECTYIQYMCSIHV